MENQPFQVSNSPTDPSIQALMKSIGLAESNGDYNKAAGDANSVGGAYQILKPNWQKWAGEFLGDSNAPTTPENQDKVAYNRISQLASEGYKPSQIASIWNSGKPDATGNVGVNKEGKRYDTPEYVSSVGDYYNSIMGGNPTPNSNPTNETASDKTHTDPSFWDYLLGGAGALISNDLPAIGKVGLPLLGAGLVSLIPGGAAAAPEVATEAALAEGATGATEAAGAGLLPQIGNFAKSALGGLLGEEAAKGIFGGSNQNASSTPAAETTKTNTPIDITAGNASPQQKAIQDTIGQELARTITGRNLMGSSSGDSGVKTLSAFGLTPDIINGIMDSSQAMRKTNNLLSETENFGKDIVNEDQATSSHTEWANQAKKSLESERGLTTDQRNKVSQKIDELVAENRGKGPDEANLAYFQDKKREYGQGFERGDSVANMAYRHLSRGARETVKGHIKHKELYDAYLKQEQNLINGRKVLKHLHNKKATKHESVKKTIYKQLGHAAAAYIGNKIGGPVGGILGYLIESNIARSVDKKYGATNFETKAVKKALANIRKKSPQAYEELQRRLKVATGELKKEAAVLAEKEKNSVTQYDVQSKQLEPIKGLFKELPPLEGLIGKKAKPNRLYQTMKRKTKRTNR